MPPFAIEIRDGRIWSLNKDAARKSFSFLHFSKSKKTFLFQNERRRVIKYAMGGEKGIGKVRVGHLSTFYHTAMLLMAGEHGGAFEWRLFATGPDIVQAFRKGLIDIAYIGLPPAVIGIASGVRIKCVAGGHIEGTVMSGIKGLKGYPELQDLGEVLGQLKGLKIGVPGKGSIHDVILSDALVRFGLSETVEVVNFRWADAITEAVFKNQVQAAMGTPSLAVAIKRYAGGRELYPPQLIWPGNPSYGIVAASEFIASRPGELEEFLMMHEEACQALRENSTQCAGTISSYAGVADEQFVLEAINMSPRYCAQLTGRYMKTTMDFVDALKRLGYIEGGKGLSLEDIFETSFIKKVHPAGDHYSL